MTMYTVQNHRTGAVLGRVRAETPTEGAQHWARRKYGRKASALYVGGGVEAWGGLYQAYVPFEHGGWTSIGPNFTV